jgi:simple sugar transport system substrate-binding protein
MKRLALIATSGALALAMAPNPPAHAEDKLGAGITMYFQMGGNPGDGATLPRTNGARAAAAALGVTLKEQYSGWQPETMLSQFREALAASPACVEIMGHPGSDAFASLVADAEKRSIVITSGNSPLTKLKDQYVGNGFGYAGVDLYEGGKLTAQKMIEYGKLKKGDKALEYGLRAQAERGKSDQGLYDTLVAAGLQVDYIEISPEVDHDSSLAVPIISAYLLKHPDLKAIGTQHGNVTAFIAKALKDAGKKPGEITVGGIDLSPATIDGLKKGFITVTLDQQLYLQGFLPVVQCVLSKKYGLSGLAINTGAGVVTPSSIGGLTPLIDKGIR